MIQLQGYNQPPEELIEFNPEDFAEHPLEPRTHLKEQKYLNRLLDFCREFPSYQLVYFNPSSSIKDRLVIKGTERKHIVMTGDEVNLQMRAGFEMLFNNRFITEGCLWLQDTSNWRLYPVYEFSGGIDGERFTRLWSSNLLQIIDFLYIQPGDILVKKVIIDGKPSYTYQAILYAKCSKVLVLLPEKSLNLQVKEATVDNDCYIFRPLYKL